MGPCTMRGTQWVCVWEGAAPGTTKAPQWCGTSHAPFALPVRRQHDPPPTAPHPEVGREPAGQPPEHGRRETGVAHRAMVYMVW